MRILVGTFHMQVVLANFITIMVCAILNFVITHFFVFKGHHGDRKAQHLEVAES